VLEVRYVRVDDGVFVITKRSTIAPSRPHTEARNLQATAWISALLVPYSGHGKDDSIQVPHCPAQIGQAAGSAKRVWLPAGQLHLRRASTDEAESTSRYSNLTGRSAAAGHDELNTHALIWFTTRADGSRLRLDDPS